VATCGSGAGVAGGSGDGSSEAVLPSAIVQIATDEMLVNASIIARPVKAFAADGCASAAMAAKASSVDLILSVPLSLQPA
jgi:hypothetical protein